jgi:hypothetical protein
MDESTHENLFIKFLEVNKVRPRAVLLDVFRSYRKKLKEARSFKEEY